MRTFKSALKSTQIGLSLVEVMIAITIGSVLMVGIVQLFVANGESHRLLVGQSRIQESARFAFDFIGRSIERAGYRGCFSSVDQMEQTLSSEQNLPYEFNIWLSGVQGFDGVGVDFWQPNFIPPAGILPQNRMPITDSAGDDTNIYFQQLSPAAQADLAADGFGANTGIPVESLIDLTDILTVRFLEQQEIEARLTQALDGGDAIEVIPLPDGSMPVEDHHMAVIHDCGQATIFKVTEANIVGGEVIIGHTANPGTDDPFPLRNDKATLNNARGPFRTDASVAAILSDTYFIAPGTGQNDQGQTPLSLWRKSGLAAPIELVEGIEQLQVLYGVDVNGDQTPNRYVSAGQVADWKAIKTIRVSIVANSVDDVGAQSSPTHTCAVQSCYEGEDAVTGIDGLVRRAFTQTFKLRNRS